MKEQNDNIVLEDNNESSQINYEDSLAAKRLTFQDVKDHCTGPFYQSFCMYLQ